MLTIDSQVHAYERNHPGRPWADVPDWPPEVTGDDMIEAMNAVGVDAAILVSAFTMYQFDASYSLDVRAAYPDRFAVIKPVDTGDPHVADTIAEWAGLEGTVGIRIMLNRGVSEDPDDPGIARVLHAARDNALPVNLLAWGRLGQTAALAAKYPETRLVIDHLGLQQPYWPPAPPEPFAELPKVLDLAQHDNVAIKISGACTLSHEPFPYNDIWDPLARIFDAFGLERCMWGTDWTRASNVLNYEQGVESFRVTDRLSDTERAELMGGALQRVYNWTPGGG